jgi:hypothetical protein
MVVPVDVYPVSDPVDHQVRLDGRAGRNRLVGIGFLGNGLGAPEGAVTRHHHDASTVLNSAGQGVGRETTEDHGVDRPDARTGQDADGQFGDHGQIKGDHIALFDAVVFEHVGKLAHFGVQRLVGELLALAGVVALPDERDLFPAFLQVPVQAVVRDVQRGIGEPADGQIIGRTAVIEVRHLVPLFEPGHLLVGNLTPEPIRVIDRCPPHLLILIVTADDGFFPEVFGYRVDLHELHICHKNLRIGQERLIDEQRH